MTWCGTRTTAMSNELLSSLANALVNNMSDEMKEKVLTTIIKETRAQEEQKRKLEMKLPTGCYSEGPGYYIAESINDLISYNHYVIARDGSTFDGNYVKHKHTIEKKSKVERTIKDNGLVKARPDFKKYECCIHVCFYGDRMKNDYTWFDVTDPMDYVGYMDMQKWTRRVTTAIVTDGINTSEMDINVYAFNGEEKGILKKVQYAASMFIKKHDDYDLDNLSVVVDNVQYKFNEKLEIIWE